MAESMAKLPKRTFEIEQTELILGNSNSNFSGVTSTMLQNLPYQLKHMNVMVMGKHHIDNAEYILTFWQAVKLCFTFPENGKNRIFHARRNNEMIQALVLKYVFFAKIKIVFTSTAQRHHSKFTRLLMNKMDAIISTCTMAAQYLRNKPDMIIAHGIQTEVYCPVQNKRQIFEQFNIKTSHCVGIFGRVRSQKGVDLFVDAHLEVLKTNKHITAIICGAILPSEMTFVEELEHKIKQHNLQDRIVFLGEQPFESIPKIIASMDLVCALSVNEGFGLTVLEALSSQVPVVATNAGAWKDIIVEEKNGFVVDVGSASQLIEKLEYCYSNLNQLKSMGEHGRAHILQNYKVEHEAKSLCDFFRGL
ncbi:glycosyltransferase family 4 protein [Marinicellulosiphila megalodicopiae]|uniref:glycosyltransferase family 4 protein n=1 Tax=Marinicellulosiphila megalodicopiae TaxID=2724896 RepID=UPI003BAF8B42